MMISDAQARLAAIDLRSGDYSPPDQSRAEVSDEVFRAAVRAASEAPDLRPDRVAEARAHMLAGAPDSHAVAEKMISRILGDSLR